MHTYLAKDICNLKKMEENAWPAEMDWKGGSEWLMKRLCHSHADVVLKQTKIANMLLWLMLRICTCLGPRLP